MPHHTTPPGMTQGRRAELLRLRAELEAMSAWYLMHGACDTAIARIDALLAGQAPSVSSRVAALLPQLTALLDELPGEYAHLRRGVSQCIGVMETVTRGRRELANRAERRAELVEG